MHPCPNDAESAAAIAALRPRGAAWRHGGEDALPGSTMGRVFAAIGRATGAVERRICALIAEFFCVSASETRAWWEFDWGLPDPCDPFAEVCDKVYALGDSTAAYSVAAAARHGWDISIVEEFTVRAEVGRFGMGRFGAIKCGATTGVTWFITIRLATSSSYQSPRFLAPRFGRFRAGRSLACAADVSPLECLIRRIAPAHADLVFTTV